MKVLDYDGLDYYNGLIDAKYAPLASPALTGTPTAPTPTANDNSTKIATTAYVNNYLPLSGGTMAGELSFYGAGTVSVAQLPEHGDEGMLLFYGGHSQSSGATMLLCGKDNSGGGGDFILQARNGSSAKALTGKPDGTLTWNNTAISLDGHTHSYLPLSGGTMTAPISFSTQGQIGFYGTSHTDPSVTLKQLVVTAGTVAGAWNDGNAKLALHTYDANNSSNENGDFVLLASDGTKAAMLQGKPNGELKWSDERVPTVVERDSGILRYRDRDNSSGTQICWGQSNVTSSGTTINFPHAFSSTSYYLVAAASGTNINAGFSSKTATSFKLQSSSSSAATVAWIAIGLWN